jgi:hypothetical protein
MEQSDQEGIRGMLKQSDAAVQIDPVHRTDLTAGASFVDQLTGSNLARTVKAPENVQDSLRKAIQQRNQTRGSGFLDTLKMSMAAGGASAGSMRADKENQRQREALVKSKEGQAVIRDKQLQEKAKSYQGLVNQHGFQVSGAKRSEIEASYRELQIAYKNAAELGVIAGPDMMLIEGIAPPSSGFGGLFQNQIKGGKDGVNRALSQLQNSRQGSIDSNEKILRSVFTGGATKDVFGGMALTNGQQQQQPSDGSVDYSNLSDEQLSAIINGK